ALAVSQGLFAYPEKISGLVARTDCLRYDYYCNNTYNTVCVVPGTYTFATFGSDADIGLDDRPGFRFTPVFTQHNSAINAQDMGSILDSIPSTGGSLKSDIDLFSCTDNAVTIN